MNKSNKLYIKALDKYQNGYINEAIDICEESISINMKNRPAINLKGLLYYLKGNLNGARALWKLNYEVNSDEVSKKYLQGLKEDENRLTLYNDAVYFMKKLNFKKALELLKKCKVSDYNSINVNNAICVCYMKLGRYNEGAYCVNEVLKINKNNKTALKNKKELIKSGIKKKNLYSNNKNMNKKVILVICLLVVCSCVFIFKKDYIKKLSFNKDKIKSLTVFNKKNDEEKEDNLKEQNKESSSKKEDINKTNTNINKNELEKNKQEEFPYEDFQKALQKQDSNKIYTYVLKWRDKDIRVNYKTVLSTGEEFLKKQGVKYFYTNGREYFFNSKDSNKAIKELLKAYSLGKESYLYQDIVYMLGRTYESINDIETALKYYNEYDSKFLKGSYEDEVLYRSALIYLKVNQKKAQEYAKKLTQYYPNSEYNNSIIKKLIHKQ